VRTHAPVNAAQIARTIANFMIRPPYLADAIVRRPW
jgi:hypothetical protein